MKVNVWQVGYTTQRDTVLRCNAQCRNMGYVEIAEEEGWEEDVWNLLNWSCWTSNKPENIYSPLDHCNADIVLQIEGTSEYKAAMVSGWKTFSSLDGAVNEIKYHNDLWPFSDMRSAFRRGYTKADYDGKAYWISIEDYRASNRNWTEITW